MRYFSKIWQRGTNGHCSQAWQPQFIKCHSHWIKLLNDRCYLLLIKLTSKLHNSSRLKVCHFFDIYICSSISVCHLNCKHKQCKNVNHISNKLYRINTLKAYKLVGHYTFLFSLITQLKFPLFLTDSFSCRSNAYCSFLHPLKITYLSCVCQLFVFIYFTLSSPFQSVLVVNMD